MQTEIYYLLCYNVEEKKWYAADHMLDSLTRGEGQVLEGNGVEGKFRRLEDGLEADLDFDNIELISEFLRKVNNG